MSLFEAVGGAIAPVQAGLRHERRSQIAWSRWPAGMPAEVSAVSLIVLVAALIRIPYLWDLPRLTDESNESFRALLILQSGYRPLTNVDPYIGPLWNYLLAAVFWFTGPSIYVPRALVAALGTLTVVPTYLLARSVGGRWLGIFAAVALALSPMHAAINSHIAWSNCITPLFTTTALWLTHRAVAAQRPAGLVWAGGAWGLALLTHPTAALFLPGVGIYVVVARPRWLMTPWPWLACGAGLVACLPLAWTNIQSGFAGLNEGMRVQAQYSGGATLDLAVYGRRLSAALALVSDSLAGVLAESGPLSGPLGFPTGLAFCVALALGFRLAAQQRNWLPVLAFALYLVLLPVVNARYAASVPKARYIAPLLPVCYVVIGLYLTHLYRQLAGPSDDRRMSEWPGWSGILCGWTGQALVARTVLSVVCAGLLVTPLMGLQSYYLRATEDGRTNSWFYETMATVNDDLQPGDYVYVDRSLTRLYTSSSGQILDHLRFVGGVYGWRIRVVDLPKGPGDPIPIVEGILIVAGASEPMAAATWRLRDIDSGLPPGAPVRMFRVLGTRTVMAKASAATGAGHAMVQ